jgi:hypothetical protein
MVAAIKTACDDAGMTSGVFADVQGNPTLENVEAGVVAFHAGDHDGVVALGGGSALDAGKAIAFASGQNRPLWDFVDVEDGWMLAKSEGHCPDHCCTHHRRHGVGGGPNFGDHRQRPTPKALGISPSDTALGGYFRPLS